MIVNSLLGASIAIALILSAYYLGYARRWGHIYASVPPAAIDFGMIFQWIVTAIATVVSIII